MGASFLRRVAKCMAGLCGRIICSSNPTGPGIAPAAQCKAHKPSSMSTSTTSQNNAKFAVFVAGYGTDYTERTYGGYGKMLVNLLRDRNETWDVFHVVDGKFPSELGDYKGFVISGSRHDAHGEEPWIVELCGILRSLHQERKKILGVCFGHQVCLSDLMPEPSSSIQVLFKQVLSRALGGVTGRAPVGWEVGLREVLLNEEMLSKPYGTEIPEKLSILQSHRDQVLELPPGGIILGSSKKTKVEMFALEEHILGIQGHPEFTKDVLLDIIETRLALGTLSVSEATEAKASLALGNDDKPVLKRLCKSFLNHT